VTARNTATDLTTFVIGLTPLWYILYDLDSLFCLINMGLPAQ
jgi:hypothetical protein